MAAPQPLRRWLLLFLVLSRLGGVEGGGGGEAWYHYAWEFAAVETAMLCVMMLVTISFDMFWHTMTHYLEARTYVFGGKEHEGHEHEHKQLYLVLVKKIGEEFMGLGLLALIVFLFEKNGIFYKMTKIECQEKGCMHLPNTALDWFHMAEIVHFSLFGGMCLYFLMMLCFVAGSIRDIKLWEQTRRKEMDALSSKCQMDVRSISDPNALGNVPDRAQYQMMHDRFIIGVLTWEASDHEADKFQQLLSLLYIDPTVVPAASIPALIDEKLRSQCFDFSEFLALGVEHAVEDAVEVHISSWIIIWLAQAVSFPFHSYLHYTFSQVALPQILIPCVVWLLLCLIVFKRMQRSLAARSEALHGIANDESDADEETASRVQALQQELEEEEQESMSCLDRFFYSGNHLMRFAQIAGFTISYVISRETFDPPEWSDNSVLASILMGCLVIVYVILLLWFYYHAPLFLGLMSLPPRFNQVDEKNMWDLLASGAKQQVFETYLQENDHVLPPQLRSKAHIGGSGEVHME